MKVTLTTLGATLMKAAGWLVTGDASGAPSATAPDALVTDPPAQVAAAKACKECGAAGCSCSDCTGAGCGCCDACDEAKPSPKAAVGISAPADSPAASLVNTETAVHLAQPDEGKPRCAEGSRAMEPEGVVTDDLAAVTCVTCLRGEMQDRDRLSGETSRKVAADALGAQIEAEADAFVASDCGMIGKNATDILRRQFVGARNAGAESALADVKALATTLAALTPKSQRHDTSGGPTAEQITDQATGESLPKSKEVIERQAIINVKASGLKAGDPGWQKALEAELVKMRAAGGGNVPA